MFNFCFLNFVKIFIKCFPCKFSQLFETFLNFYWFFLDFIDFTDSIILVTLVL